MTEYEKLKMEINHFINVISIYEKSITGLPNVLNNLFEIQIESISKDLFEQEYRLQIKNRDNFEAIVKIMKSNSILMLYNLVESTIRVSMLDYYSSLNDKQLSFSQAIESIQKLWIKNHLNQINITDNNDSFRDFGGALLTIKNKRNYLAHGNISFEDNGGRFSIQDINELKNKTYQCLDYFISLINSAIINQEFMSQDI